MLRWCSVKGGGQLRLEAFFFFLSVLRDKKRRTGNIFCSVFVSPLHTASEQWMSLTASAGPNIRAHEMDL
jgi:hypothetical protein